MLKSKKRKIKKRREKEYIRFIKKYEILWKKLLIVKKYIIYKNIHIWNVQISW